MRGRMHSFVMRERIDETGFFADRKCVFVLKNQFGGFASTPGILLKV